jgi:hypothetical protein
MSPHPSAEISPRHGVALRPFARLALSILWPAFVMAGVLEALVFVALDPTALRGLGIDAMGLSASAVYSLSFMIFWGVIATSGAITQLLHTNGPGSFPAPLFYPEPSIDPEDSTRGA